MDQAVHLSQPHPPTCLIGATPEQDDPATRLDPNLVRWSRFYNRTPQAVSDESPDFREFLKLIEAARGNVVPILVFRVEGDQDGRKYEAVYGHRRLEACRALGFQVRALVQDHISPREQGRLQLLENEGQSALSVIERGKQIASQMAQGIWPNVGALAEEIGYSRAYASHMKSIGENIPDALLLAHPDPSSINFRTAQVLVRMAKNNRDVLKARIETVRKEKANMTANAATTYLTTGELTGETIQRRRGPQATIQQLRDGMKVTIRGFGAERPEGFEQRLRAFLKDSGIELSA